ncbi:BapA/Bap/LapF family large adhesin [Acinetobacter sichuanensis]|nr:BapA/Bap/LapF family large adhesin [Acinetobacter sichuanensis]
MPIGSTTADQDGTWSLTPNVDLIEGDNSITATQTEGGKNESEYSPALEFEVDTLPPIIKSAELTEDESTLTVETEANAKVTVTDIDGNVLAEGTADGNGLFVFNNDTSLEKGTLLNITAADAAGNKSDTQVRAGLAEVVAPADNIIDLILDAEPLETVDQTLQGTNKLGFTLANVGLGPVLGVDVLPNILKNSVQIDVDENQVKDVTVSGMAVGVQLVGTMDLFVYKLNESTGQWEQHAAKENWVISWLLGGKSKETDFSLTEGKWMFVMASGEGVQALTGYSLHFDKAIIKDYNEATSISGEVFGNVITDEDAINGKDELPEGTVITAVNGQAINADGDTFIEGQYGTLTIKADGTYTYVVDSEFRGPFGSKDVFTYQVTSPAGNTAEAKLEIELNIEPAEDRIDIHNTVILDLEPQVTLDTNDSDIKPAIGFDLVKLGFLGGILSADALSAAGAMKFSVDDDTVRELTFSGSSGGVSLFTTYELYIFKLDETTGNYVQVHKEADWFTVYALAGWSDKLTMQFGEGEYRALMTSKGGLSVLTGAGLYVDHDKIYDYNTPVKYQGEVSGDATADEGAFLVKVNGQDVDTTKTTVVEGQYGTLTINADGTYTYNVTKPDNAGADWQPPYGKVDTFRLVTQDAHGKSVVQSLNIKIGTHAAQDDFVDVQIEQSNEISTDLDKLNVVENAVGDKQVQVKNESVGKTFNATYTNTYDHTKTFNVSENTAANGKIEIIAETNQALGNDDKWGNVQSIYEIFDANHNLIVSGSLDFVKGSGLFPNDTYHKTINLADLKAGEYTIEIKVVNVTTDSYYSLSGLTNGTATNNGEFHVSTKVTVKETSLTDYKSGNEPEINGNILANDEGVTKIDTLKVGNKEVYVNDPHKGAASISIDGQYGSITINKDGSYSYKPDGKGFGIERFEYETVSKLGVKETAVLEINVGKEVVGSKYGDIVESSAANDTYTLDEGADTLIYKVLDTSLANVGGNGGNGVDTWTDFNADQGDMIDISELLDDQATADNIKDYVTYEDGVLKIDRNGQADHSGNPEGRSDYVDLIHINSDKSLEELLNNNIIWH